MEIQRKKLFILGFFILTNGLLGSLYGQVSFVVDNNNSQSFVDHLFCEYRNDISVSKNQVSTFLNNLPSFQQPVDPACAHPEAYITNATTTSLEFDWEDVPGAAQGYYYASFSLDDASSSQNTTPISRANFIGLDQHLYLFAFISHCGANRFSKAFIIIAEKDILLTLNENPTFNFQCYCDGLPSSLPYDECTGSFNSYSFSYSNNCPANKYEISINGWLGDEQPYSSEVYFINNQVPEIDEIMVLSYCTPYGSKGGHGQVFGDLSNYKVIFTANDLHVYIVNDGLEVTSVTAFKCGCYYPKDNEGGGWEVDNSNSREASLDPSAITESIQIKATPNPFSDQLRVELFQTTSNTSARISVFDISGKIVATAVPRDLTPGEHQILIPTSNLPVGIYHLEVRTANQVLQQKILKIR